MSGTCSGRGLIASDLGGLEAVFASQNLNSKDKLTEVVFEMLHRCLPPKELRQLVLHLLVHTAESFQLLYVAVQGAIIVGMQPKV